MPKVLEEFVARLVWEVDSFDLKKAEKDGKKAAKSLREGFSKAAKTIKTVAKVTTAAASALNGFLFLTNKHTAIEVNRARAFGQSAATIDALGYAMSNMGIDEERIIDLTKEMNAKMGEFLQLGEASDRMSQAFGQVRDVITLTGLELEEIEKLEPAEQFIQIADAMKQMDNLQGAQAAAKILFGEEGTKIIGHLRSYDGSLRDIVTRYKALSLLTDEGRQGAVDFFKEFNEGRAVFTTLGQELAGLTGKALLPLIEQFKDWVITNRKLLRQRIRTWARRLARSVRDIARTIAWLLDLLIPLVDRLYQAKGAIVAFAAALAIGKIAAFVGVVAGIGKWVLILAKIKTFAWLAGFTGFLMLLEDIHHGITKGRSIFYDLYRVLSWDKDVAWMVFWKELIDRTERFISGVGAAFFGGEDFFGKERREQFGGTPQPNQSYATPYQVSKGVEYNKKQSRVDIKNTFNISQRKGESGKDFADRAAGQFSKYYREGALY